VRVNHGTNLSFKSLGRSHISYRHMNSTLACLPCASGLSSSHGKRIPAVPLTTTTKTSLPQAGELRSCGLCSTVHDDSDHLRTPTGTLATATAQTSLASPCCPKDPPNSTQKLMSAHATGSSLLSTH
jgi:hypothetical protein